MPPEFVPYKAATPSPNGYRPDATFWIRNDDEFASRLRWSERVIGARLVYAPEAGTWESEQ